MAKRKLPEEDAPQATSDYPVRMEELAGHGRAVDLLRRSLGAGSLASSLLITGPDGLGKTTLARMVASALQCQYPAPTACGACPSCRKMARGLHPDFRVLSPTGTTESGRVRTIIRIEELREGVLEPLSMPPYEGRHLVFLIDPADALNETCQNALLKSLEEPPAYARFLLVTASPWKLLPTVRSRCQRIGLAPLSPAEMAGWLARSGRAPEEAALALAAAAGRPGRAASLDLRSFRERRHKILLLLESGLDLEAVPGLLQAIEGLSKEPPGALLAEVSALLADAGRALEGVEPRFHADAAAELRAAAEARGRAGLADLAGRLSEAPSHAAHNPQTRLLLEWMFLTP